jgi:hypothetical protein
MSKKADKSDNDDKTETASPAALELVKKLIEWAKNHPKAAFSAAWPANDLKLWFDECDRLCDLLRDDPRIKRQKKQLSKLLGEEGDDKASLENIQDIMNKLRTIQESLQD